jgi:sphingolipid 8-(E)-desaturase
MVPAVSPKNRVWSRREIEGLIADGRKIIILDGQVVRADAWLPYHPGGDKSMLHMVGRDGTDEIKALHSKEAQAHMQKFVIGRIHGRWENFLPPIQGGTFRTLVSKHVEDEALYAEEDFSSSGNSTPPSPVFDTEETRNEVRLRHAGNETPISRASSLSLSETELVQFKSAEALTAHAISTDLSKYPPLDKRSQDEIVSKYRQLDERLRSEGLYQCPYSSYAFDFARYTTLFILFSTFLHYSYYALSGLSLGLFWHQLVFTAHDAGHMGITHGFHTDTCIGIFIADFLGGLSIGWWKRNHNVHHIVTNSPEHDPDIEHMPFFAISHRFLSSLRSTYYDRDMTFNAAARFLIKYQHYLYYPVLLMGRFNLYVLAWSYLMSPTQAPRKGPAWWHRYLEMAGQVFFWYWFGYQTMYLRIPTWSSRITFLLISHMVTAPLHVQLTLSHFAMSTANLGIHESFAQKMLRTTMDVDCPPWLDFVHGGLQFQVVHHLYPRIPRHNLRRAQKYVKEFCHDVGIPYVIFGFARGNKEVIGRLSEVAGQLRVLEECRKVAAKDLIEGHHGH